MNSLLTITGKEGVSLQAITAKDLEDMAVLANNPRIAAFLRDSFPSPYSLNDARQFLALIQQGALQYVWGIYSADKIAGVITITPQTDIYRHTAEIGYWLGEPFHGKGIMTEAVKLATEYAFKELNLYRIFAGVFAPNEASKKVLLKNDFYLESIRKKGVIKNGQLYDDYLFVKLSI